MAVDPASTASVWEFVGRPRWREITWAWLLADLDLMTVATGRAELAAFLSEADRLGCVLAYLGVERFVDPHGLRLLQETASQVRARGGELVVVAPPTCLRVLLDRPGPAADLPLVASAGRGLRRARALVRGHRCAVSRREGWGSW